MFSVSNMDEGGIRYGVASAHNYPDLYDEITTEGTSTSCEAVEAEVRSWIKGVVDDGYEDVAEFRADLKAAISDYFTDSRDAIAQVELGDSVDTIWDILCDCGLWDHYYIEEEEYRYKRLDDRGIVSEHYELNYLGGAALIWVIKSPETAFANLCSPCCPGAGNLDSLDPDGYECYAIPAEYHDQGEVND